MIKIKKYIFNFVSIIITILLFDFFYTNISNSKYFNFLDKNKEDLSKYYEKNDLNRTVLKKNLNTHFNYNKFEFRICTNKFGFRDFCEKKNISKKLGTVFTGDSVLFGKGLNIENTFFGIAKEQNNKITNISEGDSGVRDSFNKVQHLVNKGFKIDKIIYFFDVSDIQDESYYYKNSIKSNQKNSIKSDQKNGGSIFHKENIKILIRRNFSLTHNFLVNIKYYYLPKPVYRYHYKYQRSAWTYDENNKGYEPIGVNKSIDSFLLVLEEFYKFANDKNIPFGLSVIPWPNQILYDFENSRHAQIASTFCKTRCSNFINLYPDFFRYAKSTSKKKSIQKLYLDGDMHLSEFGHNITAKKIISSLNDPS